MDLGTGAARVNHGLHSWFSRALALWLALLSGCGGGAVVPTVPSQEQLAAVAAARSSPGAVLSAALEAMTAGDFATFYLLLEPSSQQRQLLGACEDAAWHLVTHAIDPGSHVDREVEAVSAVLERHGRDPEAVDTVIASLGDLNAARMHVAARKRLAALYARDPAAAAVFYAELMKTLSRAKPMRTAQREVTDLRISGDEASAIIVDVDTGKTYPAAFVRREGGWLLVTEESISTQLDRLRSP